MRRRSGTVLLASDATSTTVVKPECVSIAYMSRVNSLADRVAAFIPLGPREKDVGLPEGRKDRAITPCQV